MINKTLPEPIKSHFEYLMFGLFILASKIFDLVGEFLPDEICAENQDFIIKIKRKDFSNN